MKKALLAILLICYPSLSLAAISYGTAKYGTGTGGALTLSSFTVATDDIIVVVCYYDTNSAPTETLKWNTSEDLTRLEFAGADAGGTALWYLNDPSAATASIVLSSSFTGSTACVATAISGADNTVVTPASDVKASIAAGTSNSLSLTTDNDNSEIFSGAFRNGTTNSGLTVGGTNQTQLSESPSGTTLKTSKQTTTTAGSYSSVWNVSPVQWNAQVVIEIKLAEEEEIATSTATSTTSLADIAFGQAILISIASFSLIFFIYNSFNKKKRT